MFSHFNKKNFIYQLLIPKRTLDIVPTVKAIIMKAKFEIYRTVQTCLITIRDRLKDTPKRRKAHFFLKILHCKNSLVAYIFNGFFLIKFPILIIYTRQSISSMYKTNPFNIVSRSTSTIYGIIMFITDIILKYSLILFYLTTIGHFTKEIR